MWFVVPVVIERTNLRSEGVKKQSEDGHEKAMKESSESIWTYCGDSYTVLCLCVEVPLSYGLKVLMFSCMG